MTVQITQPTINPIVPANAGLNVITLSNSTSPVSLVYPTTFIQSPNYLAAAIIVNQAEGFIGGIIVMPSALIVTQSVVCSIKNSGSTSIEIQNFDGGTIVTIDPGKCELLFLLPSDTAAGVWESITIGAGTSSANAAALAGYGLIAIATKLNSCYKTETENSSITLAADSDAKLYSWKGGNLDLNLNLYTPTQDGFYFLIKNESPSNGILNLDATSIDGGVRVALTKNQSCFVIYNIADSSWKTVGLGNFSFGAAIEFTASGIKLINGSAAVPSLAYISQPSTGIYSQGLGDVSFSSSGNRSATIDDLGLDVARGKITLYGNDYLEFTGIYP
jgi:hypothetical protein